MRFRKRGFIGALLVGTLLAGCGAPAWTGEEAAVTTLGIDRQGRVLEVVVEPFQESYYSVSGLRSAMEEEIASYVAQVGTSEEAPPIELHEVQKEGGDIRTSTTYQTTEDYSDFTLEALYYGTLRQAALRGFEMPSFLTKAEGGMYAVAEGDAEKHVVFTDGHDHIVAPYRILAFTEGVKLVSETEADFSGTEGRAALLLER